MPLTAKRTKLYQTASPRFLKKQKITKEVEIAAFLLSETEGGFLFCVFFLNSVTENRELLKKVVGLTHRTSQLLSL